MIFTKLRNPKHKILNKSKGPKFKEMNNTISAFPSVGICAFRKSGNYLLIRIFKAIFDQLNCWDSYSLYTRCWEGKFQKDDLSYPEEAEIDEFFLRNGQFILYKGPYQIPINVPSEELDLLKRKSRLILTHQAPTDKHIRLLNHERKWIYVLRDGRAVINSWMHYAVSPVLLKRHPQEYKIQDVRELYELPGYLEKHIKRWKEHVKAFKKLKNKFLLVKFEELLKNKQRQIERILEYFGFQEDIDVQSILEQTQFSVMKRDAPIHVRKGQSNDWRHYFSFEQTNLFRQIAGDILIEFGYEKDHTWVKNESSIV